MIDKDRLLASFLEMVKIASPSRKEGIFAAYLQKQMEDMGLEVIIDEQSREKSGSDSGNPLVLHLNWKYESWNPCGKMLQGYIFFYFSSYLCGTIWHNMV